ncbi:hypothetical protein Tco_0961044 [Tanacetum coccineum]
MEAILAFLKEYDHIPPNEKCLALLLAEERFLKIKQVMRKEQNQHEVLQELLLKLMNDLQILKGIQQEKEKQAAQGSLVVYLLEYHQSWNRPTFYDYDDDDDDSIPLRDIISRYSPSVAITSFPPVLPTRDANDSLSIGDEHLDTIPSIENLVPIPSEFKGIFDDTCDVPVCEDPSTFDALNDHSEILSDSNDDDTSSDDDDFEDIEYISLEDVNDVEEKEFDLEDILQIQDVILREKLLNISRLITNIESLNDNPTPNRVLKSPSSFPIPFTDSDSFFEEFDTSFSSSDNSLPELEQLISIVISDNSNDPLLELPEFESFHFNLYDDPSFPRPPPEPPDVEICFNFEPDTALINNFDELNEDEYFDPGGGEIVLFQNVEDDYSFTFVIRTFLPFLTYHADSPLLISTGSEDTIFDPCIST